MTETKPTRRWFRFSLRTLFVVVTIVGVAAGWVTYQLNWLEQRREFIKHNFWGIGQLMTPSPPWPLSIMGEEGFDYIGVPVVNEEGYRLVDDGFPDGFDFDKLLTPDELKEVARARRLFPEATTVEALFIRSRAEAPNHWPPSEQPP